MSPKETGKSAASQLASFCDRVVLVLLHLTVFLIPVFFIIITRDQFELPKLTVLRILTAGMLGAWAIRCAASGNWAIRRTPLDLPLGIWVGLQILTTFTSISSAISWLGEYENFRGLLTVLNYVVLYYVAVTFLRTREQIDRLLFTVLLTGLVVTAYGIAQFFGLDFIRWNPDSIAPGRYFSSLGNPNFLAAYLSMVMPLLVIFYIETSSRFKRMLLFFSFVIMYSALMGTWSRGGLLGLMAALTVLGIFGLTRLVQQLRQQSQKLSQPWTRLLSRRIAANLRIVLLIGLALAALVTISATFGRQHMLRMADTIIHFRQDIGHSRLHIWNPAWKMIKERPWLGSGLDTFKSVFPRYATPDFAAIDGANVSSRTAHNEILQVVATQGVIGLIIVTWLTVMILVYWWKAYRKSAARWRDRLILVGLLASWTTYSVQNLFSFGVVSIDTFYWLILALIMLFQYTPEEQATSAPAVSPPAKPSQVFVLLNRFRPIAIGLILVGTGWLAWQGLKIALADYAYNLGTMYRMRQMWNYSILAFSKAADLVPHEVKYRVYEGLAYEEKAKAISELKEQQQLIAHAIAAYQQGVDINPTNAYYLANLGRAYEFAAALQTDNKDYYDKAVHYFEQAIQNAPVTVLFYQNLAMTYLSHGDEKNFSEVVNRLAAFHKLEAAKLVFNTGNQLYNLRQIAKAHAYYQRAVELQPQYVEALYNLGVTTAQMQNPTAAIPFWRKALELRPDFEPARQMLLRYQEQPSRQPSQAIITR